MFKKISMDPKEQFAAVKDMRSKGRQLLGNFHFHPKELFKNNFSYCLSFSPIALFNA